MRFLLARTEPVQKISAHSKTLAVLTDLLRQHAQEPERAPGFSAMPLGLPLIPDDRITEGVIHLGPMDRSQPVPLARPLRASDVSRQLGDAGHQKTLAEQELRPGSSWTPGYRSVQINPALVHTFHDGPHAEHHLRLYALALTNLGYRVRHESDDQCAWLAVADG
ncbi:hypothetical protein [Streptomyces tauricus]